jgi:hypothetical protein
MGEVIVPTLIPWTTVEIGDADIFSPTLPSLVVYTCYVDDLPESTVAHFWRDEDTGMVCHELLLIGPITFEEAVAQAHVEAPKRKVDKIHVKHARVSNKSGKEIKGKRSRATSVVKPGKRAPVKRKTAKPRTKAK